MYFLGYIIVNAIIRPSSYVSGMIERDRQIETKADRDTDRQPHTQCT